MRSPIKRYARRKKMEALLPSSSLAKWIVMLVVLLADTHQVEGGGSLDGGRSRPLPTDKDKGPPENDSSFTLEDFLDGVQKHAAKSPTMESDDSKALNVHIVPHTHDDVGWLKTVDQYYHGLNDTIQHACVNEILDTTVEALLQNDQRTFVYVEQKFFSIWWNRQTDAVKDSLRYLIARGQFSFANGGWCMHDEAGTHFMGMIDQTTLGHDFLKRELGVVPTVGWQIDPFGHSATQASLLTSKLGFDAFYFGRIDHSDLALRNATQGREGLWSGCKSWRVDDSDGDDGATVFWGLTGYTAGMYGAPPRFCFDFQCDPKDRLVGMNQTMLLQRIETFLDEVNNMVNQLKGNHVMLTMGMDFQFERAEVNFGNLDVLIGAVQTFQRWGLINAADFFGPRFDRINIFYSSPEYYTQMKYEEAKAFAAASSQDTDKKDDKLLWPVKTDDFFPYSNDRNCHWTGYFTSRTTLKRMERVASSFLLGARQLESALADKEDCDGSCCDDSPLFPLDDALGIAQHHDAVAGTAKQHVAYDYAKRMATALQHASKFVAKKLKQLVLTTDDTSSLLDNLSYCQLLNETICPAAENADSGADLYIVVYNQLATARSTVVAVPLGMEGTFEVSRMDGFDGEMDTSRKIQSTREKVVDFISHVESTKSVLHFDTGSIPPLGAAVLRIQHLEDDESSEKDKQGQNVAGRGSRPSTTAISRRRRFLSSKKKPKGTTKRPVGPYEVEVNNGLIRVIFDSSTGVLKHISNEDGGIDVTQEWGYYTSFDSALDPTSATGDSRYQNSGAYIFRPSAPNQAPITLAPAINRTEFRKTGGGTEVHVYFEEPWMRQVTRILAGQPYVEVEYTIGPVSIEDGRGKEVVTRYSSPIRSDGVFYTDSNGREFLQRKRNYRPTYHWDVDEPVAGNFYPVNAAIYIEDQTAAMSVVVDRSQGGTSLVDGSLELMAQRRILRDDWRGVDEPLNETTGGVTPYPPYGDARRVGPGVIISGKHRLMVGKGSVGASLARSMMDAAFAEPLVFVASAPSSKNNNNNVVPIQSGTISLLPQGLPSNVMLVTYKLLRDGSGASRCTDSTASTTFLIRLGHQYAVDEDSELSQPVEVDLASLFADGTVASVVEKTLSGNQDYSAWVERRMHWTNPSRDNQGSSEYLQDGTVVVLKPMEIRTFEVQVERNPGP